MPGRARAIGLGVVVGAGIAALTWELLARPAPWVLCEVVVAAGLVACIAPGTSRSVAINVAVIAALLLPVELYLAWTAAAATGPPPPATLIDANGEWVLTDEIAGRAVYQSGGKLVRLDSELGWVNRRSVHIGERMFRGERLLYDVVYNTDARGLRLSGSPHAEAARDAPLVLFFGCSFTFGQGVADSETLAAAFEAAADGSYRAMNLATIGAGTHTVVRFLELGRGADLALSTTVAAGIYVAIRHHLERIQGNVDWAAYYPKYEIRDGELRDAGRFSRRRVLSGSEVLLAHARKSHLFDHLYQRLPTALGLIDRDGVELFVQLVGRARDRFVSRHGGRFMVVLWDDFGPEQGPVTDGLRRLGVTFYTHAEIFPAFDPARHYLPEYEHPSAAANVELGAFLAAKLDGS